MFFAPFIPVMPPPVAADVTTRLCGTKDAGHQTNHSPSLRVEPTAIGDALNLTIELISPIGSSAEPNALRAFVAVDGRPIVLTLPKDGAMTLTFPGLERGVHEVRFGTYYGNTVMQAISLCPSIGGP